MCVPRRLEQTLQVVSVRAEFQKKKIWLRGLINAKFFQSWSSLLHFLSWDMRQNCNEEGFWSRHFEFDKVGTVLRKHGRKESLRKKALCLIARMHFLRRLMNLLKSAAAESHLQPSVSCVVSDKTRNKLTSPFSNCYPLHFKDDIYW